jgi:hypothetical protein
MVFGVEAPDQACAEFGRSDKPVGVPSRLDLWRLVAGDAQDEPNAMAAKGRLGCAGTGAAVRMRMPLLKSGLGGGRVTQKPIDNRRLRKPRTRGSKPASRPSHIAQGSADANVAHSVSRSDFAGPGPLVSVDEELIDGIAVRLVRKAAAEDRLLEVCGLLV